MILAADAKRSGKWSDNAFFGLHYDLHPTAGDTELGREVTYEHIREQLEKVKPDYVQYDCKGHPGYTGYPTKVGSPSPGIVNDSLKVYRKVTKDMGIPLSIHYSGVWDSRAIEVHPEWAMVDAEGAPNPNATDRMSAYTRDLMIPQLIEVLTEYDLDGVWVDGECWASPPSWTEGCKREFAKRTGITDIPKKAGDPHWAEWLSFQRDLFVEHVRAYAEAVHKAKPDVAVCSNWMYSVRQPDSITVPVDYLSGDFDPSFGSERACAESRVFSAHGKPWNLMAWAFLKTDPNWPAFHLGWTLKPVPHLCQEVAVALAQGGGVFVYNVPQRTGRLTAWHQDVLAQVAQFCRQRKDYCFQSETVPQVAVLHSRSFYYAHCDPLFNPGGANIPMEGAVHGLLENGYSVDILNEDMLLERIAQYPIVVVPEQKGLPETVREALRAYVENGGRLIVSGDHAAQEFGDWLGVTLADGKITGENYIPANGGAVIVSGEWQRVACATGRELAPLLRQQEPERDKIGFPAATINAAGKGVVVAVHGPLFRIYGASHYPRLRSCIGDMVHALEAPRVMRHEGPWWIEMSARQKDGRLLIQFVNRSAAGYLAPNRHMVENVPNAGPFVVRVPMDKAPARCYLAPDPEGLEWSWKDGVLTARMGGLAIHNVLVIEP
ncbi:MAG TPA: hypothetical protein PLO62_02110 [Candidatus Hydrogenedentes bacterium]|nr:hypothetical protein [Candidatus Hydrogenedentota bacterium]